MSDSQKKGQRARILRVLLQSRGREVPAFEPAEIALQYNARIFQLRAMGFDIQSRSETVNGQKRSWFRLAMTPVSTQPDNQCTEVQDDLFGEMNREHLDLG
jgi:hypothetical protein